MYEKNAKTVHLLKTKHNHSAFIIFYVSLETHFHRCNGERLLF